MHRSLPESYLTKQEVTDFLNICLQNSSGISSFVCAVNCLQVIPDPLGSNTLDPANDNLLKLPEGWAHAAKKTLGEHEPISLHWIVASSLSGRSQKKVSKGLFPDIARYLLADLLCQGLKKLQRRKEDIGQMGVATRRGGEPGRRMTKQGDMEDSIGLIRSLPHQHYLLSMLDDARRDSALRIANSMAQAVGPIGEAFLKMFSFLTWPMDRFLPNMRELLLIGTWLQNNGQLEILDDLIQHPRFRLIDASSLSLGVERTPSLSILRMLLCHLLPTEVIWVAKHAIERHIEPEALSLFELCMLSLSKEREDEKESHDAEEGSFAWTKLIWSQLATLPIDKESWSEASPFNDYFRLLFRYHLRGITTNLLIPVDKKTIPEVIVAHISLFQPLLEGSILSDDPLIGYLEVYEWQRIMRLLDYFLMLADGTPKSLPHVEAGLISFIHHGLSRHSDSYIDAGSLHHLIHMNIPYVLDLWIRGTRPRIDYHDKVPTSILTKLLDEQANWRSIAVLIKYMGGRGPKEGFLDDSDRKLLDRAIVRLHEPSIITLERRADVISLCLGATLDAMSDDALLILLQMVAHVKLNIPLWIVEDTRWEGRGEVYFDLREIKGLLKKWLIKDRRRQSEVTPLPRLEVTYCHHQEGASPLWIS